MHTYNIFFYRKYSFNEEESFNIDALGLGGNVEQNVIYSQDSFLPRSVAVNLTTEVFGHNLNVLEVKFTINDLLVSCSSNNHFIESEIVICRKCQVDKNNKHYVYRIHRIIYLGNFFRSEHVKAI